MTSKTNKQLEKGSLHWLFQRITAISLIPLGIWLAISLIQMPFSSYERIHTWLGNSITAFFLAFMMVMTIYHASIGMQQIYKDYIHGPLLSMMVRATTNALAIVLAGIILLSIYRVWQTAI